MKKYSDLEDLRLISESALESSLAGFWDWDMVSNEEYLSPRFKEMFGYAEHEMENTPEAWQKIAFQEDLVGMFDAFNEHVESQGKIAFHTVVRYNHKSGKTIWVRCNGKVVKWSDEGKPLRAIGCHVDITEEKELELELKKALAEKDVLLSEVHHRVKNNLQLIISLTRLKQKRDKLEIHELEDSINAIANAHEAIYRSERFDNIVLQKYIERIVNRLLLLQEINFTINSDHIVQEINFLIPIGLIITECINNSLKHAFNADIKEKSIHISIKKENNSIKIKYSDSGSGYKPSILSNYKENDSLGIILINSLAEQINGEIKLSNEDGATVELLITTDQD